MDSYTKIVILILILVFIKFFIPNVDHFADTPKKFKIYNSTNKVYLQVSNNTLKFTTDVSKASIFDDVPGKFLVYDGLFFNDSGKSMKLIVNPEPNQDYILKFNNNFIYCNRGAISFYIRLQTNNTYKFSTFNHGIGNYDSFPSVLKKDLKIENNLVVTKEMIAECQTINIVRKDVTLDKFFAAKLIYYNIDFQFIDKANKKKCEI